MSVVRAYVRYPFHCRADEPGPHSGITDLRVRVSRYNVPESRTVYYIEVCV